MRKSLGVALAGLAVAGFSVNAMAAQLPTRVRGTIESIHGNTLAIKSYSGKTIDLMLKSGTKYAWVVPASLSDIKSGDFIGTAATGPENAMKAQEVVIFPKSMKGTGEGHYGWSMPAAVAKADAQGSGGGTQSSGAPPVQGTMTNGTVTGGGASSGAPPVQGTMTNGTVTSGGASSGAPPVQGTMTNGTVSSSPSKAGGKELTISYNNGKKVQIMVRGSAPVVRFIPSHKSVLAPGSKVFAVATQSGGNGKLSANFVAVGKNGLMPPM